MISPRVWDKNNAQPAGNPTSYALFVHNKFKKD